ncbi:MAG: hypothetical protein MZV63_72170 [Marinilabiliales bacterium]|nr:hypothetical protein [Marinilabiliales bacterium]
MHPKLRPVETAVNGIVLAGTAQGPMNIQESCSAAGAAAAKVAALLTQGKVELEPFVAVVDPERCTGSGECVRLLSAGRGHRAGDTHRKRQNIPARRGHPGQLQRLRRVRERLPQPCD